MVNPRTVSLRIYNCPSDRSTGAFMVESCLGKTIKTSGLVSEASTNSYAACYGALGILFSQPDDGNGVFYRNSQTTMRDITDGTSSTLAIGERCALFTQTPWAGVMTAGAAVTTPGAPVYSSSRLPSPALVLARIGYKA